MPTAPDLDRHPGVGSVDDGQIFDVVVLDIAGFSALAEQLIAARGPGATEDLTRFVGGAFAVLANSLSRHGFMIVDSLGDGMIAARPADLASPAPASQPLADDLAEALERDGRTLRLKLACVRGTLTSRRFGGWRGIWETCVIGPAVATAHELLASNQGATAESRPRTGRTAAADRPGEGADFAEIRWRGVAFLRLVDSAKAASVSPGLLQEAVLTAQTSAEAWEGRLEKVTQDDKGLLLRCTFEGTSRRSGENAALFATDTLTMLTTLGFAPAAGVAEGYVYRSAAMTHGPAVNRAAKLVAGPHTGLRIEGTTTGKESDRPPNHSSPALLGRGQEMEVLQGHLGEIRRGRSAIVLVEGPAGIGKSSLLETFRGKAAARATLVVSTGDARLALDQRWLWRDVVNTLAPPSGSTRHDTLDTLGGEIGLTIAVARAARTVLRGGPISRARSRGGGVDAQSLGSAVDQLILALLDKAVRRGPVVVIVDDAQWLDPESVRILTRVAQETSAVLVALGRRTGRESGRTADVLGRTPITRRIELGALSAEDARRLVLQATTSSRLAGTVLDHVVVLSGGNPFFVMEMTRWLDLGGGALEDLLDLQSPEDVPMAVLHARLDGLAPHQSGTLRALSVLGRPLTLTEFRSFGQRARLSRTELQCLPELVRQAFVRRRGGTYEVSHPLLQDAVVSRMPPSVARRLHGLSARHLAASGRAEAAALGHHWRAAGQPLRAGVEYARAAEQAVKLAAYPLVVSLYGRALACLEDGGLAAAPARTADWRAQCASANWSLGEMKRALDEVRATRAVVEANLRIRRLPAPLSSASGRLRALAMSAGLVVGVHHALRDALVLSSSVGAELAYYLGDLGGMLGANFTAVALSGQTGQGHVARGRVHAFGGYLAGLLRLDGVARTVFRAGAVRSDLGASFAYSGEAVWHIGFGRWAMAEASLALAQDRASDPPHAHQLEIVQTLRALVAYLRGDLGQSADIFRALAAAGAARRNRLHEAWGCYGQAQALLADTRQTGAEPLLFKAQLLLADNLDHQSELICAGLAARSRILAMDADGALDAAERTLQLGHRLSANNFSALEGFAGPSEVVAWVLSSRRATGPQRARANHLAPPAFALLQRFALVFPIARPRLILCRGLVELSRGHDGKARRQLAAGLTLAQQLEMQVEVARLRHALNSIDATTGDSP